MQSNPIRKVTVLTLVHKRRDALLNLLAGLSQSICPPAEVVIVHMNEQPYPLRAYPFQVCQYVLEQPTGLNLSAARNFAIEHSSNEWNIFLDVDCIPGHDLLETYLKAFQQQDVLYTGRIRYMSEEATQRLDLDGDLIAQSIPDPIRSEDLPYTYELFWSLNFGCSKTTFTQIGGFDESFEGYGGEDTDFSFAARRAGVRLITIPATAFHQYHPSYSPPINHLQRIVANAIQFHSKWEVWPMKGWLDAFSKMGYITWEDNVPTVSRLPTDEELEAARK